MTTSKRRRVIAIATASLLLTTACGDDAPADGDAGAADRAWAWPAAAWDLGAPIATDDPPFAHVTHPLAPTKLWGDVRAPYPTNAEWMNLVLGDGRAPVNALPYVLEALDDGLRASLPAVVTSAGSVDAVVGRDVLLGAKEAFSGHAVVAHDLVSATLAWSAKAGGTMTTPLVHGMAYVTAVYAGLTPRIATERAITTVNGAKSTPVKGDRFEIALDDGRVFVVYAPGGTSFAWDAHGLVAAAPIDGPVRVAHLGDEPGAKAALDAHRGAWPVGGEVSAHVEGDVATIGFTWKKAGAGSLIMMALPHHAATLVGPKRVDGGAKTVRGPMIAVEGDAWTMREPLSPITWSPPRPVAPARLGEIKVALVNDASLEATGVDPYFFGKSVARLGRLALVADELGGRETARALRDRMKAALEPWLAGTNADALRYDTTWGGVCSTNGLADSDQDFGQGYYNDHHFHYGYFLYAAAVIAKADRAFFEAHRGALLALARDVANPSTDDARFPRFRATDFYAGHSWASGLFAADASRNQESTSEAVNAWYGLALLGLAAEDENLANLGRVLLALETRGAQTYWHVREGSSIYDAPFADHRVVGVLWSNRAVFGTFFCGAPECVHGIQLIPFTPASEALLEPAWIAEEAPVLLGALTPQTGEGWRGFAYMAHAIVAPDAAWQEVKSLRGFDDGNSRTNALHWAATRPAP